MQWDEDTWVDISDPPSPVQGETRATLRSRTVDDLQEPEDDFDEEEDQSRVSFTENSNLNEKLDLHGSWRLLNHVEQEISKEFTQEASDIDELHKLAQELLESCQELATLAHQGDNCVDKRVDHQYVNLERDTDPSEKISHLTSSASEPTSFKTDSLSPKKPGVSHTNRQTNSTRSLGRKKARDKSIACNQKTKEKPNTSNVNISTKVPHSLCKNKCSGHQKKTSQNTSTSKKPRSAQTPLRTSSSCDLLSEAGNKKQVSELHGLFEYRKLPTPTGNGALARYSLLKNNINNKGNNSNNNNNSNNHSNNCYYYEHGTTRKLYNELYEEEEEDKAKAAICVFFCFMGVGIIVGLVCLLSHYVEETELHQMAVNKDDDNVPDLMSEVYYSRVADLIRLASESGSGQDQANLSRPASEPLRQCHLIPGNLLGNTTQLFLNITPEIDDVIVNNTDVMDGGEWKPRTCTSRHRVAIIIPYRDRWNHLKVLLYYLIPTLKRQQIHFRIFVVEQYGNDTFNKGRIMNAAFREALKLFDFHCVTFHDVDLVPEDDRNMYTCTEQPKHMSNSIDKFKYILPYQGLVGGVLMFKREHFQLVNGYSNMYWGWGAEDDDMTTRILSHGLRIYRPPSNIAKYKMVKHDGRKSSEVSVRMRLLRSAAKRSKLEGLNNVKYRLLDTHIQKLFTHFIVDIGHP